MSSTPSPLERRAIEVRVAAATHRAIAEVADERTADEALALAVERMAHEAAGELGEGRTASLGELWDVWQRLGGDDRLDLHLDALDEHTLRFHVDRCAYADLYRDLGIPQIGIAFSCRRDRPFAEALVPGVRVEQSTTILEGADRCEFTYTLEER